MAPLTIRAEQMRALRAPFLQRLFDAAIEHAHRCHADVAASLHGDDLAAHVHSAIDSAAAYDLASQRDVLRFVSLTLVFGGSWNDAPGTRWMHDALMPHAGASRDASMRLHAFYGEALARLSRGEIPAGSGLA
ncbi:MAG TPA: hypothetical protein VN706_18890 [Gemmatimonadaceae bacterium]|nr:hypothetical protein [Gemmatimonadaceae bacterium]